MSTALRKAPFVVRKPRGRRRAASGGGPVETLRAPARTGRSWLNAGLKAAILLYLIAISALAFSTHGDYTVAMEQLRGNPWGLGLQVAAQAMFGIYAASLLWRFILVLRYRPAPACTDEQLPACTVIVPAYNEGRDVLRTLRTVVRSDYPAAKLQIIAVDDGSRDDTWVWICKAVRQFPGRILALRQPVNSGKRAALYEGFRRSTGTILVTIDSDSEIETATLRRLVSPFHYDAKIGAVAGNVRVLNRSEGIIPRMLDVSFVFSFDFIRASQSRVNTVFCTPGALAAYRRDVVMAVLPEWMAQEFCGLPANIGEDRALTNLIIRDGYHIHFQRDAVVHTKVPVRYKGLAHMFLRWERSNVRETLVMFRFLFRKFRSTGRLGARVNLFLQTLSMTVGQVFKLIVLAYLACMAGSVGPRMLLCIAVVSSAPAFLYLKRHRSSNALWAYLYGVFWVIGLSWISLYALVTPHKNSWLTRQLPAEAVPPATAEPLEPTPQGRAA